MPDTNTDAHEDVALADESVTIPVLMSLSNGLDPHIKDVSQCNIQYHFVWYASCSVLRTKFLQLSMSY